MSQPATIPPPRQADEHRPHPRMARATVLLTAAFAMAMIALIYSRWLSLDEPRSFVQVDGDAAAVGTVVRVESVVATSPLSLVGTVTEKDNYSLRFFLRPGQYRLIVEPTVGQPFDVRFLVDRTPPLRLDLRQTLNSTTRPNSP